jgi:hypothetical protein
VTENPFHARSGDDGRFEIRGVPPGTWTLRVWHEQLGTRTLTIDAHPGPFDAGRIPID